MSLLSNPMMHLLAADSPLTHVVDHPIIQSGDWYVLTNHMVMMLIAAVLMLLIFPRITRPYQDGKLVPTGSRNFFEAVMLFIRNDVAKPVLGVETDRFMPLLWTFFFFILFCNLLGLLPLDLITTGKLLGSTSSWHGIYGTATSNFAVTATLAVIVFFVIQTQGIKANGIAGWAKHFLGGAPWWLFPVMVPVEILGMLIKPFALAVRLAANMTAGHILLAVIIGFVPATLISAGRVDWTATGIGVGVISVIAAVAVMMLETFVACLQAYLFTFLAALFISQMVVHEHEEGHHNGSIDEYAPPIGDRDGDKYDHHHTPDDKPVAVAAAH